MVLVQEKLACPLETLAVFFSVGESSLSFGPGKISLSFGPGEISLFWHRRN